MDEYLIPSGFGEDEFYEKKSHFIGRVWQVDTEEEALERIQAMKKQHYDATHNFGHISFGTALSAFPMMASREALPECPCFRYSSGRGCIISCA